MTTDRELDIFTKRHQYISHNFHKFMELKFHDTYKTVPTYIVWVNIGNGISFIIGYYSKNDRSRH